MTVSMLRTCLHLILTLIACNSDFVGFGNGNFLGKTDDRLPHRQTGLSCGRPLMSPGSKAVSHNNPLNVSAMQKIEISKQFYEKQTI